MKAYLWWFIFGKYQMGKQHTTTTHCKWVNNFFFVCWSSVLTHRPPGWFRTAIDARSMPEWCAMWNGSTFADFFWAVSIRGYLFYSIYHCQFELIELNFNSLSDLIEIHCWIDHLRNFVSQRWMKVKTNIELWTYYIVLPAMGIESAINWMLTLITVEIA